MPDAVAGNWVDRRAPARLRPFLRLSRADRPIGTWLLLIPCWWGVTLAAAATGWRAFDLWIIAGCAIGAALMRGAGCTWNDITDRHIDAAVARTRARPVASGQVGVTGALGWIGVQAGAALLILLTFNTAAIVLGFAALVPVAIYPFAKRFTWWPQIFLGLAFNWGALLAWTAHTGRLGVPALLLYLGGIFWTIVYDTIYAHQDREDDALIGVKSTALLFGARTRRILAVFVGLCGLAMAAAVLWALAPAGRPVAMSAALLGVLGMVAHMIRQLVRLDIEDGARCLGLFRSNRDAGLIAAAGFALAGAL